MDNPRYALTTKADGEHIAGDRRLPMWREASDWLSGIAVLFFVATLIVVL